MGQICASSMLYCMLYFKLAYSYRLELVSNIGYVMLVDSLVCCVADLCILYVVSYALI